MSPAHQRLDATSFSGRQVDNGLVVQLELVSRHGVAQIELESPPQAQLGIHALLEEPVAVAAIRLGPIERQVGIPEKLIRFRAVLWRQRDPDADPDDDPVALDLVGCRDVFHQPVGQAQRFPPLIVLHDLEDRELIATEPAHGVAIARSCLQALSDGSEQGVTHWMAQ